MNVEPLPVRREVDKEEKAIERLRGEYQDTGRHSLAVAVGKKERKIESLSTGFIRPYVVTYIIRVWDETEAARAGDRDIYLLSNLHQVGSVQINAFQRVADVITS